MDRLFISKGEKVSYKGKSCIILRIINVDTVSIEEVETHIIHTINVKELQPFGTQSQLDYNLHGLSEKEWEKANERYDIIKPILGDRGNLELIQNRAKETKTSISTIYRWLKLYDNSGLVSGLVGKKRSGGKGQSRLSDLQENIILDKINSIYMNGSRKSKTKTIREIQLACDDFSIPCPHPNTIRNRINDISEEEKIRKRFGIQEARYKYEPIKGKFPNADYPLSVVQMDHTPVDIILVDEVYRKPLKRPWLTVAIDVYSRMVLGFYLSFDTPGFLGAGMCIANAILPKEMWLEKMGIDAEWPCWGIMDKLHMDNAKEFIGDMMEKSCMNYGIHTEFRPVATPHYGGHIERLLGTFSQEIHNLPGTTFSSSEERKRYNSAEHASFTLSELEKWLAIYITKIYHIRMHSEIKEAPIERYRKGLLGDKQNPGKGIPPRINNERRVRLDFMPFVERTVQEYGIQIDHIYYYSDALRAYIHDTNSDSETKKSHVFKRDPRDISAIYFYNPVIDDYIEIPYRDASLPPMSIWEHREILRKLKESRAPINEKSIFAAFREMNEIEERAIRETRNKKRNQELGTKKNTDANTQREQDVVVNMDDIQPFDDIDDEAFIRKH